MTSVHSQPINTNSYTETEPLIIQECRPKYIQLLEDIQPQSNTHKQHKKLPFNFFLSAAQYNKMLITNGKSRKNKISQTIDGLITTLQYMNDPIFQRQISKRQKFKQTFKQTHKAQSKHHQKPSVNDRTHHIKNSFSHDQSQQYIKNKHRLSNLSNTDTKKGQTIDYDTLIPKQKKYSINYKPNHKISKANVEQKQSHNSFGKTRKFHNTLKNDQSLINKSQTKKTTDISHLLLKSLIEFTQQKRADHFKKLAMEKTKNAKDQYLKLLNKKIRSYNLENSRRSGDGSKSISKSKSKSITKHQISLNYWDQIKEDVLNSLKNDNYSHPLKNQLKNYSFNVYDHKQIPPRKPRMSSQQMDNRRLTRGFIAEKTIQQKSKQKKSAQKIVKQNLRSLQKERKKRISHNPKKPFRPTADLIHSAFRNLVEPCFYQKEQKQVRNGNQIFMNEGLRIIKGGKKQKCKK